MSLLFKKTKILKKTHRLNIFKLYIKKFKCKYALYRVKNGVSMSEKGPCVNIFCGHLTIGTRDRIVSVLFRTYELHVSLQSLKVNK